LIKIAYTSTSAEQSARIANAFAEEYLRTREQTVAQQRLADLAATYGPKHPSVLKGRAQLEEISKAPTVTDHAQILVRASPPILSSGPDRKLIVAFAFIGSFAAGIALVWILERANTSFRSGAELATEAKAPCLGIFAEGPPSSSVENARAIVMAAGLATQSPQSRILLVTCSLPEEGGSLVSTALAHSLVRMGKRALLLDLSREAPNISKALTLENVLDKLEYHTLQLDEQLTVMQSASQSCEDEGVVTSRSFSMLLEQARDKCDLLIIAAPPVLISADALYLGRQADFVLHVVRWNSTPRRAVLAALERLRNLGVPVDGVTLSRVHEKESWRLNWSSRQIALQDCKGWERLGAG